MHRLSLSLPVEKLPYIGSSYSQKLNILGINTAEDLLRHFPSRYLDYSQTAKIYQTRVGDTVVVKATLDSITSEYTKTGKNIQKAIFKD